MYAGMRSMKMLYVIGYMLHEKEKWLTTNLKPQTSNFFSSCVLSIHILPYYCKMRNSALLKTACIFILLVCTLACANANNSEGKKIIPAEKNTVQNATLYAPSGLTSEQINRLNASCEVAKKDLEIALLADVKEKENAQILLWASLSVIIFLALVIMFLTVKHLIKRRSEAEAEKKLKEYELQETKTRLHHNVNLVDGFTQRILDKNKVIAELEKKIRSNPSYNQSTEAAKKNLEAISESRILTHEDWEKFQATVNKVYPGLIARICDSFPLITDAELRMFLLIKLSVKNKDISEILGISPDSVRKTRFRLKKKLNLTEEADLDDFIMDYNGSDSALPREKLN